MSDRRKEGIGLTQGHDPDWSDLECLLALWLYHRIDRALMTQEPINKAALYREVAAITGRRTPKAVEFKVQNVSACDPRPRSEKPISALPNKQDRLQELFDQLWPDRRHELEDAYIFIQTLREHGASLISIQHVPAFETAATVEEVSQKPDEGLLFIEEGRVSSYEGERRNRSSALTKKAREYYRNEAVDGLLRCAVCRVSFDLMPVDTEIMHIHHLNPIAQADESGRLLPLTKAIASVRPVCPTCHAIIHSRRPLLSLEEARTVWEQVEKTRRD